MTAPVQIVGGFMLLGGNNARVLGGEVDHMIKKWDLPNVSHLDYLYSFGVHVMLDDVK